MPLTPEKAVVIIQTRLCSIKKDVGVEPLLVPRTEALALPIFSKRATLDTTPIQRQISYNIQNDKKLRVNANIYSI